MFDNIENEEMPIQEQIEQRVQEQKEEVGNELPEDTRSACVEIVSKIANKLFNKKASMTRIQKKIVANELNNVGDFLEEDANEQIAKIGEQMKELTSEDFQEETNKVAKKVASYAKKLIIIGEREMENTIEEKKLVAAEKLVKIAQKLKAKKKELTASEKQSLQKVISKVAKEIEAIGEEETGVDKSDIVKDYNRSNRYSDKRLNECVNWKELANKGTSIKIKPNTQLKDITLDDLRKVMVSLRGI